MGTWRCVGSGHWPRVSQGWDAVGPGAPRPSPVTGQGGAHAARSRGRWEEQRVRTGGLQPLCSQVLCALTRSLVGFGKPESRERGRHPEVLAEGPEGPGGLGWAAGCLPRGSPGSHPSTTSWDHRTREEVHALRRLKALGVRGRARAGIPSTPAPAPAAPSSSRESHAGRGRPPATEELTRASSTGGVACPETTKAARSRREADGTWDRGDTTERWEGQSG